MNSSSKDATMIRWLGVVSAMIYAAICWLSFDFTYGENYAARPILLVLAGFGVATALFWFVAFRIIVRSAGVPVRTVLGFAIVFRLILLASQPIQEIDYYRYLWDGRVTMYGLNPFAFSPAQVEKCGADAPVKSELCRIRQISDSSVSVRTIFERIHHREVPTVYPPVAQIVFAAAAWLTPADAPLWCHVGVLKAIIVAFDLAALGMLVLLLRQLRLPENWCVAYGWCPLAVKEFANSGHLDAIAIFLVLSSLYVLVRAMASTPRSWASHAQFTGATVLLALGVLAKSYPIVLLPVVVAILIQKLGARAVVPLLSFVGMLVAGYLPFAGSDIDPPVHEQAAVVDHHPFRGLETFLTRWQMNDLLFMLVHENLRWKPDRPEPWCVIVPSAWREGASRVFRPGVDYLGFSQNIDPAFLATQAIMGSIFLAMCLVFAVRVYRRPEPNELLRGAFLSLIWGWLLSSAQNPWYLLWAWPFVIFAKQKSWWLLPGLAFLYYLRFWLEYQSLESETTWRAAQAQFDFVVVWWEHAPFFLLLILETTATGLNRIARPTSTDNPAQLP